VALKDARGRVWAVAFNWPGNSQTGKLKLYPVR
jgi:hypothetical protein